MTISYEHMLSTITILLSVLAAIGSAVAFFMNRPNQKANALKTMSETIDHLSGRVAELEADREQDHNRIMTLETEAQQLERLLTLCVMGLHTLTNQLIGAGLEPNWKPSAELRKWKNSK